LSAFAVVYERSGTPADPAVLDRMMERLSHRGPDGSDISLSGHIAMGHWHFWTTPEEVGEKQPLQLAGLPFKIVFDGRIDNRSELFSSLGINSEEEFYISDAALVLHAYKHLGEQCFERFIGDFAFVLFDEKKNELICARDALGIKSLYYAWHGTKLVIASEPWAVAGSDNSRVEANENAAAIYFSLRIPDDGQTLFKGIYELLPAQALKVSRTENYLWKYWMPDLSKKIRYKTDEEYAAHFLSLLEESVRCRMRSTTPTGVMMSGGLDSTTVASLAARMIAPQQLKTISYVFDKFPDCDER